MNYTFDRNESYSFTLIALFAALMAVMGLIPKIDLPFGVPITLQSLATMLAGCLLGARRGFQSVALFLLAVAVGLPLLAGGRGGIGVFMAPSAGYLLGYPVAALVTGLVMRWLPCVTPRQAGVSAFVAAAVGGVFVLHLMGIAGLVLVAQMDVMKAMWVDLAFVPGDLVKCVLCGLIVHTVSKAMPDWRLGGQP
ncbi:MULTISPECIES: biotin transporter BioY [Giesbergeria]|uniref:Biotin transporter n=1 Tax=Giesbergeria sinuosa TaxID=80883 RepID=A0ABV9QBB8_9BURK